jgi:glycerol-1-phosphate dehydrogenase [NAD(P)+]
LALKFVLILFNLFISTNIAGFIYHTKYYSDIRGNERELSMSSNPILKIVESEALLKLSLVLQNISKASKVLLIADNKTWSVAGERAKSLLIVNGYQIVECILERDEPLVPDERALGEILVKLEPDIEILLAVGSGSITDLTRYIAYKFNKPFVAIPTAPSMDGYSSSVAPLTIRGFKQTLPAVTPAGIVADIAILVNAPTEMILAGFGDLLGKYTSLADWKLGQFINGEGYSEPIAAMVRTTVDKTVTSLNHNLSDPILIQNLTDALIISGEAMQQWGDSRPASGAEHHLAHFWEMQDLLTGKKSHLHGTKVGIAVILVAEVYHKLFKLEIEEVKQLIAQSKPELEQDFIKRVKKVYGPLADDILKDLKGLYLDPEKRAVRQRMILDNWTTMQVWVENNVPTGDWIRELMFRAGASIEAKSIDVSEEMLKLAMENAKEVRTRYTVFRLAEDIGWK